MICMIRLVGCLFVCSPGWLGQDDKVEKLSIHQSASAQSVTALIKPNRSSLAIKPGRLPSNHQDWSSLVVLPFCLLGESNR